MNLIHNRIVKNATAYFMFNFILNYIREWRSKVFLSEDEEEDTLTFYSKDTFIFKADESSPLNGNELLTIPHPVILVSY